MTTQLKNHLHDNQPILTAGPSLKDARSALVMIHGRGASAESILRLYPALESPAISAVAPQAAGNTWYPHSFLVDLDQNQPWLDSAMSRVESIVDGLIAHGIPSERIAILGFSQGACMTTEYAARHPRRYGALLAFSGGLIGPTGTPRNYPGSLDGTPILIGCSDTDAHVPVERVYETKEVLQRMGGNVDLRIYPGMPHIINDDEIAAARLLLQAINAIAAE